MGTRHMIGVVLDGDFRVAQYGQWDGYPSGQGVDVLNFLRDDENVAALRKGAATVRFATEEDRKREEEFCLSIGSVNGWMNMEQAGKYKTEFPALDRDVGSDILKMVAAGSVEFLHDSRDFAEDSLFCEWAYVVDLDNDILECYEGFQKSAPLAGRWAGVKNGEYAAMELVATYLLSDLPSAEDFCLKLDPEEEE